MVDNPSNEVDALRAENAALKEALKSSRQGELYFKLEREFEALLAETSRLLAKSAERITSLREVLDDFLAVARACEAQGKPLPDFTGTVAYVGSRPMADVIARAARALNESEEKK